MKVHELLQIELWKRKPLRGILIGFGIVVGVLVVGSGVSYVADWYWLTPGERNAGKAVLAQIDSLQNLELINREDFEAREKGLPEKLKTARESAFTLRDKGIYSELFAYLLLTESERSAVWKQKQMEAGNSSAASADIEPNKKKIWAEKDQERLYRMLLHEQLD
jgi:hypothetical protein